MKTLGLYLLIFGIASLLLNIFGFDLRILSWIDTWGTTYGYLIRGGMVALGLILMFSARERPLAERFPELKELEDSETDSPGENAEGLDSKQGI